MLKAGPEINQKFMDFYHEVFKDGKLSLKTKELIALSVSLGAGCQPCYEAHLKKAKDIGNTEEEIREAIAVAEVISSGKIRMMVYSADIKGCPQGKER
jgi:AhpD family alkylhydroperoxidase